MSTTDSSTHGPSLQSTEGGNLTNSAGAIAVASSQPPPQPSASGAVPSPPAPYIVPNTLTGDLTETQSPYFRCHPLEATISVAQCRSNRLRMTVQEALRMNIDVPSWMIQPLACRRCPLAREVDGGRVRFYSAEEVLAGLARGQARSDAPITSTPILPSSHVARPRRSLRPRLN